MAIEEKEAVIEEAVADGREEGEEEEEEDEWEDSEIVQNDEGVVEEPSHETTTVKQDAEDGEGVEEGACGDEAEDEWEDEPAAGDEHMGGEDGDEVAQEEDPAEDGDAEEDAEEEEEEQDLQAQDKAVLPRHPRDDEDDDAEYGEEEEEEEVEEEEEEEQEQDQDEWEEGAQEADVGEGAEEEEEEEEDVVEEDADEQEDEDAHAYSHLEGSSASLPPRRWKPRTSEEEHGEPIESEHMVAAMNGKTGTSSPSGSKGAVKSDAETSNDTAAASSRRRDRPQREELAATSAVANGRGRGAGRGERRKVSFGLDQNEELSPTIPARDSPSRQAPAQSSKAVAAPKPAKSSSATTREQSPTTPLDVKQRLKQLEQENKALRLELGQERFKIKQLGHLRDEMGACQRQEMLARKAQKQAMQDLDQSKAYVGRREEFVKCEKEELRQQILKLERAAADVADHEHILRTELEEAVYFRDNAADLVDKAKKETEQWKKEALELNAKIKTVEHKMSQLDQRHAEDKAKIKTVLEQSRSTNESTNREMKVSNPNEGDDGASASRSEASKKVVNGNRASTTVPVQSGGLASTSRSLLQRLMGTGSADSCGETGTRRRKEGILKKGKSSKSGDADMAVLDNVIGGRQAKMQQRFVICALIGMIVMLAATKLMN